MILTLPARRRNLSSAKAEGLCATFEADGSPLPPDLAAGVEAYAVRHGLTVATAKKWLIAAGLDAEVANLEALERLEARMLD